jgi:hypothetical protein
LLERNFRTNYEPAAGLVKDIYALTTAEAAIPPGRIIKTIGISEGLLTPKQQAVPVANQIRIYW